MINLQKTLIITRWIMTISILIIMVGSYIHWIRVEKIDFATPIGEKVSLVVKKDFKGVEERLNRMGVLIQRLMWKDGITQNWMTSYYGKEFHGKEMANRDVFNMYGDTAAHKYLPFGTVLSLRNPLNNRTAFAMITDRGPFIGDRELDVSWRVAEKLGMLELGTCLIEVKIIQFPF